MAEQVYPLGRADRVVDLRGPGPDPTTVDPVLDPVERDLFARDAALRQRTTPLAPPLAMPGDPWVVPVALWRKVAADDIRRRGSAMAIRQDGADTAFNIRRDAALQSAVSQFDEPPNPRALVASRRAYDYDLAAADVVADKAIREINMDAGRMNGDAQPPGGGRVDYLSVAGQVARLGGDIASLGGFSRTLRTVPQVVAVGADALGWVGKGLSIAFDGQRFVKHLVTSVVLGADSAVDGGRRYGGDRERAGKEFDAMYRELPRPVQLAIDELSPGAMSLAVLGGPVVKMLEAAGGPAAIALANVLRPLSSGMGAFPRQAASGIGLRFGYEQTDGMPIPVRLAVGFGGAFLAGQPEALLHPSAKYVQGVWRALVESPELREASGRSSVLGSTLFPGLTPQNALTAEQSARLTRTGYAPTAIGVGDRALGAWITPDGREISLSGMDHGPVAMKLGSSEQGLLDQGWVRKAALGQYQVSELTPETAALLDETISADAKALIEDSRGVGRPSLVIVEIGDLQTGVNARGGAVDYNPELTRVVELSPYADQRARQLAELTAEYTGAHLIEVPSIDKGLSLPATLFPGLTPQNAAAAARALAPSGPNLVGAGLGATYGFVSGDTVEDRLKRAGAFGALGYGAAAYLTRGGVRDPLMPPDVLPFNVGARTPLHITVQNPVDRFALNNAGERAVDLADQRTGQPGLDDVPSHVGHALEQARTAIREDGQVAEHLLDMLPGGSRVHQVFNPGSGMPLAVRQAYWAAGSVMNTLRMRLMPSRATYQEQLLQRFGGLDDAPNIRYIGSETGMRPIAVRDPATGVGVVKQVADSEHPLRGKLVDIAENPTYYDLSLDDLALLARVDIRNTEALNVARSQYGVMGGEYPVTGVMHLPIVDKKGLPGAEIREVDDALIAGRMAPRRFSTITERMTDPVAGLDFEPVTDMRYLLEALDESKVLAAGGSALRWGVGGQVENTGGLRNIQQWGVYVPDEIAGALADLGVIGGRQTSNAEDAVTGILNGWRQFRLSADSSPLTLQGALGAFSNPVGTARALVSAARRGDFADMLSSRSLVDDWARDPGAWLDFASNVGIRTRVGTPEEFRAGVIERMPFVGARIQGMNDSLFNLNIRAMKRMYEQQSALLVREGVPQEAASAAAADTVTRIIPLMDARKLGLNAARQRWENAIPTSASFIRQTLAFTTEAATGYVKLGLQGVDKITPGSFGQWSRLSPQERLAVQFFTQMQGTMIGLSVVSSIATADDRHLTVTEAAERAVDSRGGDFMRLWLSGSFSVPLGGPHRGLMRAVARTVSPSTWDNAAGPAGGLIDYVEGRLSPGLGVIKDIATNRDFSGQPIFHGAFGERIVQGISYLVEQALPLSAGEGVESFRRGLPFVDGLERVLASFAGTSGQDLSRFERVEQARRGGAITGLKGARAGLTPAQVEAASGARTLAQLKDRIGTTAAVRFAESNAPEFSGSYADYSADVLRRAAAGDRDAQALAVGIRLQQDLDATVRAVGADKQEYRRQRADVVAASVGASDQYRDVFDGYRKSTNEIDVLAAQWYDLRDRARRENGTVDFKMLGELQDQFYAALPGKTAELVRENVEGPPRGANKLEVELRQVRRDLEDAGFFKMTDDTWTYMRERDPRAAPFEDRQAFLDATAKDFELRNAERGFPAGVAAAYARTQAASVPTMERYDAELEKRRLRWVPDHAALADQASEWGYAPDSEAFSKAVRRSLDEGTSPPAAPSGRGRSVPVPDSASLWEGGSTYAQIGIALGTTAGAVEQQLRRYYGGSPVAARDKLSTP